MPLFKQPRAARAKRTELLLGAILGAMLLGLAVLADRWHIGPRSGQTVLSQIIAMAVGRQWAYYMMSLTITIVLALAANTSFGGLPVLASLLARDNYLPHLFSLRDDRQVFAAGVWALAITSGALLVAVRGNTLTLIPLFAIGVFTGFTLSQSGLVVHWWRTRPPRWQHRAIINGVGAAATAVATVVFLATKFIEGAWVVVLAIPAFICLFVRIRRYYERAGRALGIGKTPGTPHPRPTMVVVPVIGVSRLAQQAIAEALSISEQVVAVTVVPEDGGDNAGRGRQVAEEWAAWNPGAPLRVLQPNTPRWQGPSLRLSTSYVSATTSRSSCSSRWCSPASCVIASCTTTLTGCLASPCRLAPTSSSPASRCRCTWQTADRHTRAGNRHQQVARWHGPADRHAPSTVSARSRCGADVQQAQSCPTPYSGSGRTWLSRVAARSAGGWAVCDRAGAIHGAYPISAVITGVVLYPTGACQHPVSHAPFPPGGRPRGQPAASWTVAAGPRSRTRSPGPNVSS